jgi:hypothetical protein
MLGTRLATLIKRISTAVGRSEEWSPVRRLRVLRVMRHKALLASLGAVSNSYRNVAFVFQPFNKGHQIEAVLSPILQLAPTNVIVLADGCGYPR